LAYLSKIGKLSIMQHTIKGGVTMKKLTIMFLIVFMASYSYATDQTLLEKAKAEGKVSFYANITAIQPIMESLPRMRV